MAEPATNEPAKGQKVGDKEIVQIIQDYRAEATLARKSRIGKNLRNVEAYLGQQDYSEKLDGQSQEFIPKVSNATEQFAAFVQRGIVQFGSWFDIEFGKNDAPLLTANEIRDLITCYFGDLAVSAIKSTKIELVLADAVKSGLLEALIILKVHGRKFNKRQFFAERGAPLASGVEQPKILRERKIAPWRLMIDVVRADDYFPDPTGRGLYEIHSVERDYHEVLAAARQGIYDLEAVLAISGSSSKEESGTDRRSEAHRGQDRADPPSARRVVLIDECWGTLLNAKGEVMHENVLCAVANGRQLIRRPEPNPFWHGESPFIAEPIIRVPHSVWHKALYDDASQLNLAFNELFNLALDGAMKSVWGINQIRLDMLEDPSQVSSGVVQGDTLAVTSELPHGQKAFENVSEGQVPPEALAMLGVIDKEFTSSALSSELKLGKFPQQEVKATEVTELAQSQAVTLDAISANIEVGAITQVIRKSFLNILQNADDLDTQQVVSAIGPRAALVLARMDPADRFAAFAGRCDFKVFGLTATLGRVRDFQKFMALMQGVNTNPLLMRAFLAKFSADKVLTFIMRALSLNPDNIFKSEEELADRSREIQEIFALAGLTQPGSGGGPSGADTGEPGLPAEINQLGQAPLTGGV
jgi:hypothetical protein